jgi:leucyl/phenylalanyl-tRNA--protein transferase
MQTLTPELLLRAYAMGIFPMAEARDATEIHWIDPRKRGVFPLESFHISRSLARHMLRSTWRISVDEDFDGVLAGCADRPETWINAEITALYRALHHAGFVHSLEVWDGTALIGGVYGVVLGAAFFGESMFSRRTNASKTALAYLIDRLRAGGFMLFDTQFLTPHLATLGAVEIPRADYRRRLEAALNAEASFTPAGYQPLPSSVVAGSSAGAASGDASSAGAASTSGSTKSGTSQRNTQTS